MDTTMSTYEAIVKKNNQLISRSFIFLFVAMSLFFAWGLFAKLHSASISSGVIIVESKKKNIQHLEGGIVNKVFVDEGQYVHKGQALIKISDVSSVSKLKQTELTLLSYQLKFQRLISERDNQNDFYPDEHLLSKRSLLPEFDRLIQNQKSLFFSRMNMRKKQLDILDGRLYSTKSAQKSSELLIQQKKLALQYLDEEITMHEKLIVKGYTSKQKLLELQRSKAGAESDIISIQASINDSKSKVEELIKQKNTTIDSSRTDIENELYEVSNKIVELRSSLETQNDLQKRTIVRSPSDGIVMGMQITSPGEVVPPRMTMMEIVPAHDQLLVETMIKPTDIDVVKKGQQAEIRLTAYNSRTTPMIKGVVTLIDADTTVINDQINNSSGYKAQIKLDELELSNISNIKLYPGMPVEVYITIKEKTPLEYLVEPFKNSVFRAFREE